MLRDLFWIAGPWPGQLAIAPRPRGDGWLEDEMKSWREAGVNIVVSLLTSEEIAELGLERESDYCSANGIAYYSLPVVDRGVPESAAEVSNVVRQLDSELAAGQNVAVHCRGGIGRSAMVAVGVLMESGLNAPEAIQRVSDARHFPVPETQDQREWIESFGAALQQSR